VIKKQEVLVEKKTEKIKLLEERVEVLDEENEENKKYTIGSILLNLLLILI
jgi:hypothetical protein